MTAPTAKIVAFLQAKLRDNAKTPTFAFLDPFGYKSMKIASVEEFLAGEKKRSVYQSQHERPVAAVNESKSQNAKSIATRKVLQGSVTAVFGDDGWKSVQEETDPRKRRRILVTAYKNALVEKCGAKFPIEFGMRNETNGWVYFLVYATKHPKGLELMKDCMKMATDGGDEDTMTFSSFDFVKGKQKSTNWVERCADDIQRQFRSQRDVPPT